VLDIDFRRCDPDLAVTLISLISGEMTMIRMTASLVIILWAAASLAAERWVVGGHAIAPCSAGAAEWALHTIAFNSLDYPQSIRLLGVSNGGNEGVDPVRNLGPRDMVSLSFLGWRPSSSSVLWVLHLDVPEGVEIAGMMALGEIPCFLPPAPDSDARRGTTAIPVFRTLNEANEPHVHLATGLGQLPHRTNVALYNHGSEEASVVVEQYSSSTGAMVGATSLLVPPRTILQVPVQRLQDPIAGKPQPVQRWIQHVIVRMDQPGFSLVSNLAEEQPVRSLIQIR
jgi:hypothetical protein